MAHHVLLIEDNAASRELVRYLLEAHGMACQEAPDGETGLEKARTRRPDLVVCDLQMPGMDGFAVLRALRAMPGLASVPVVAVTAYAMVGDRDRVLAAGFDGYISKPLDPGRFVAQLAAFMGIPAPDRLPAKGPGTPGAQD